MTGIRPLFRAAGRDVMRLSTDDAPALQRLLERCDDYYDIVEGRPAGPHAAIEELTEGPPERMPQDVFGLGIAARPGELAGFIAALRHYRRPNQWYLGLMLLDPAMRGRGLGRAAYLAFEEWVVSEGADPMLLAVVEPNHRRCILGKPRFRVAALLSGAYIGLRKHVLIELEKNIAHARNSDDDH